MIMPAFRRSHPPASPLICCRQLLFKINDFLDLREKPRVDLRQAENLFNAEASPQRMPDEEDPFRIRNAQLARNNFPRQNITVSIHFRSDAPRFAVATDPAPANFQ